MMKLKDIIKVMQEIAPESANFESTDFKDNVGLILGDGEKAVKKVMLCLDASRVVIQEAIEKKVDLIISHHPFIYNAVKKIDFSDNMGEKILLAANNNIAIYSAHTNLDFVANGINQFLADLLGLKNTRPLIPYISETEGYGRVGDISPIALGELQKKVEKLLDDELTKAVGDKNTLIKRVAVCNGGCGDNFETLNLSIKENACVYISADFKHHIALYAFEKGINIIGCEHYKMEKIFIKRLVELLKEKIADCIAPFAKTNIEIFESKNEQQLFRK